MKNLLRFAILTFIFTFSSQGTVSGALSPDLTIEPIFNFTMGTNNVSSYKTFKISNKSSSNSSLPLSLTVDYGGEKINGWVELNRSLSCGEFLSPQSSCLVHLRTNSKKLKPAIYDAKLSIASGDAVFNLPIKLEVFAKWLALSRDKIVFDLTKDNPEGFYEVTLGNESGKKVDLKYITVGYGDSGNDANWLDVDFYKNCPDEFLKDGRCTVMINVFSLEKENVIRHAKLIVSGDDGSRQIDITALENAYPSVSELSTGFDGCSYDVIVEIASNSFKGADYSVTDKKGSTLISGKLTGLSTGTVAFSVDNLSYGEDFSYKVIATNGNGEQVLEKNLTALNISSDCGKSKVDEATGLEIVSLGFTERNFIICETDTMTVVVNNLADATPAQDVALTWSLEDSQNFNDSYSASIVLSDYKTDHEGKGQTTFKSGMRSAKYKVNALCADCKNNSKPFIATVNCMAVPFIKATGKADSLSTSLKMLLNHYGILQDLMAREVDLSILNVADGEAFNWKAVDTLTEGRLNLKGTLTSQIFYEEVDGKIRSANLNKTKPIDNNLLNYYLNLCVPLVVKVGGSQRELRWVVLSGKDNLGNYIVQDPIKGKTLVKDLKVFAVKVYFSKGADTCN